MRKKRKSLKKDRGVMDIDINSLLDILVIMLVFLLKSYTNSSMDFSLPEDLTLTASDTKDQGANKIFVSINRMNEIFVNTKKVGDGLKEEVQKLLTAEKEKFDKETNMALKQIYEKNPTVNLVVDQSVNYNEIKKVMDSLSLVGIYKFNLVVRRVEG